jgi:hypothetical protein
MNYMNLLQQFKAVIFQFSTRDERIPIDLPPPFSPLIEPALQRQLHASHHH